LCHELICWLASSFGDQHFSIDLMASDGQVFIIIIIIKIKKTRRGDKRQRFVRFDK
jgi:hypothetical protein